MRNFYWLAKCWTYSMMYGPSLHMPPSTLNRTSGSDSVAFFWTRLGSWLKTMIGPPVTRLLSQSQRSETLVSLARRYRHIGAHRGQGRQTYAGARELRMRGYGDHGLLAPTTEELSETGNHAPGSRAYRKLAWSQLSHEATKLRKAYKFEDDQYGEMP